MTAPKRFEPRAHLAALALVSFIASFAVARTYTTFFPSTIFITGGVHIHHFWYGLAMLAAGGWLGISYDDKEIERVAAILYGAGGGLIVDEAGLLLTFGDYWSGLTFSVLVVLLAFALILIFVFRYRHIILRELGEFERSSVSFYFGVLLFAVSIAFVTETTDIWIITTSVLLAAAAIVIVVVFLVLRGERSKAQKSLELA